MTTAKGKKRFASLLVCGLCLAAAARWGVRRAAASRPQGPVLVDGSKGISAVNTGTYEARADGTVVWPRRYLGIAASMNWSAYDYLEFVFYNPGSQTVSFSFEIKDADSNDYWTRVNLPQVLGPGLQTIRLPTRLRVGETGRPGRPLDSTRVVSLILARDDANDRIPVEIRRIELKKAIKTVVPGILAFHVGPEDAGVPDGFEALTEKTSYDPARKWGWLEHEFWAPYPQVNRVMAPDLLTASNLAIASAKLRIDLKPGTYRVWMIIDHPGGFWGEYPYYHRRTVRAQGRIALDESLTPEKAEAEYFRWQDAEDRESDDLFDKYWSRILKEKTFDAKVENGHLDLEFKNEGCPGRLPCFGLALSALTVFPVDTAEQRARGESWLARLRESRRAEFDGQHQLKAKALTRLLDSMPSGLGVWNVSPDLDLNQALPADVRSLQGTLSAPPRVSIFRNSRGAFAPAVSWKGAAPRELSWRVEGVPAGVAVEGGWIKRRAIRDSYAGNVYSVKERWITEDKKRTFAASDLGRLWLRFAVPRGARPGLFPAVLIVASPGTPAVRIPFELRVYKGEAEDLDFPVGPFNDNVAENWWDEAELRPRLEQLEAQSLLKMRALGMTAFSFVPRMRAAADGDGVSLDTREVDRVMETAKRLGFKGAVGYGEAFVGEDLCAPPGPDSVLVGTRRLRQATDALEARARERHWLPLALIACDEPVGERIKAVSARLADLPRVGAGEPVQWSVTTSLGPKASAEARTLVRQVSLPFLSEFSPEELKFPWAFYNDASRRSVGLGMFRLRQTTDLRYRLLWVWNQNQANPYFDFDSREGDLGWCSSTASLRLQCSVELERVIERGLTDYRVALGLKKLLETRGGLPAAQKERGLKLLEEAQSDGVDPDAWLTKTAEFQEEL